jgi:hypothetical protein
VLVPTRRSIAAVVARKYDFISMDFIDLSLLDHFFKNTAVQCEESDKFD